VSDWHQSALMAVYVLLITCVGLRVWVRQTAGSPGTEAEDCMWAGHTWPGRCHSWVGRVSTISGPDSMGTGLVRTGLVRTDSEHTEGCCTEWGCTEEGYTVLAAQCTVVAAAAADGTRCSREECWRSRLAEELLVHRNIRPRWEGAAAHISLWLMAHRH